MCRPPARSRVVRVGLARTALQAYRLTIFNYYAVRSREIELDGTTPTVMEQLVIDAISEDAVYSKVGLCNRRGPCPCPLCHAHIRVSLEQAKLAPATLPPATRAPPTAVVVTAPVPTAKGPVAAGPSAAGPSAAGSAATGPAAGPSAAGPTTAPLLVTRKKPKRKEAQIDGVPSSSSITSDSPAAGTVFLCPTHPRPSPPWSDLARRSDRARLSARGFQRARTSSGARHAQHGPRRRQSRQRPWPPFYPQAPWPRPRRPRSTRALKSTKSGSSRSGKRPGPAGSVSSTKRRRRPRPRRRLLRAGLTPQRPPPPPSRWHK